MGCCSLTAVLQEVTGWAELPQVISCSGDKLRYAQALPCGEHREVEPMWQLHVGSPHLVMGIAAAPVHTRHPFPATAALGLL